MSFFLPLLNDFLQHLVCDDDGFHSIQQGISLCYPLSPLLGALFLKPLDDAKAKTQSLLRTLYG